MPSTLNATTTNGLVTSADNSGSLQLQTNNGTTAVTIDTSQNVGIGTTSPTNSANYKTLSLNGTTGGQLAFQSGGTLNGSIYNDASGNFVYSPFGYAAFWTAGAERMRINSSGQVLAGTTTVIGNSQLSVLALSGRAGVSVEQAQAGDYCFKSFAINNGGAFYYHYFVAGSTFTGQITSNGTTTAYATTSDYRLKENVAPMTNALSVVQQLKPVTYKWKLNGSSGQGFLAHELQEVCPDAVTGEKDAVDAEGKPVYQSVDTSFLVATLTAAIQELKAELDATKAEVQALKGVA